MTWNVDRRPIKFLMIRSTTVPQCRIFTEEPGLHVISWGTNGTETRFSSGFGRRFWKAVLSPIVLDFAADRNLGLLFWSHMGSVTQSEFDIDSQSRLNQLVSLKKHS